MAKRNTGVGGVPQLQQTQYQTTELSVPNPTNPDMVPAQSKDLQLIQQSIAALGTSVSRAGRALRPESTTGTPSDKGAQATIAQALSEEKKQGFDDGIIDRMEDIEQGLTPENDFWSEVYYSFQQDEDPNKNLGEYVTAVLQQMGDYEASQLEGASPEIFQREYVKTLSGPAISWMNRTFVDPERDRYMQDTAMGLATLSLDTLGVDRILDAAPQIREELDGMIAKGVVPKGTTTNELFLEGAQIAIDNADYQRATGLLGAVRPGKNAEGLKAKKAQLTAQVHNDVLTASAEAIPAMLEGNFAENDGDLIGIAIKGPNLDTTAGRFAAAAQAWADKTPLLAQAQQDRMNDLLALTNRQGQLVFPRGSLAHSRLIAVQSGMTDGDRVAAQRRQDTDEINAAIATFRLSGKLEVGDEIISTPSQLRAHVESINPNLGVVLYQAFSEEAGKERTALAKTARGELEEATHRSFRVQMQEANTVEEVKKIIAAANGSNSLSSTGLRDIHSMASTYTKDNAITFKSDANVRQIKTAIGATFAETLNLQFDSASLNISGINLDRQEFTPGANATLQRIYHEATIAYIRWRGGHPDATDEAITDQMYKIIDFYVDPTAAHGAPVRANSHRIDRIPTMGPPSRSTSLPSSDQPS